MQAEVIVPELGLQPGESVVLSVWFVEEGEPIYEGDRIVELLVAGSTFDISAPATGTLTEILAFPEDDLQPGQVLGLVEIAEVESEDPAAEEP